LAQSLELAFESPDKGKKRIVFSVPSCGISSGNKREAKEIYKYKESE